MKCALGVSAVTWRLYAICPTICCRDLASMASDFGCWPVSIIDLQSHPAFPRGRTVPTYLPAQPIPHGLAAESSPQSSDANLPKGDQPHLHASTTGSRWQLFRLEPQYKSVKWKLFLPKFKFYSKKIEWPGIRSGQPPFLKKKGCKYIWTKPTKKI